MYKYDLFNGTGSQFELFCSDELIIEYVIG